VSSRDYVSIGQKLLIINGGSVGLAKSAIIATKLQLDIFNFIAVIRWGLAA